MAPSCEPLLRSLKNIFLVTNCEKITVSDFSSEKPLESKAKRIFFFFYLQGLWRLYIYDLGCGSMWCQSSQFCSRAKGHTGGFLHNVWFSPSAYLLITAITTATLVCLFTGMVHQCACIPLTGADVSGGRLGRDTAVRGYADCRCGIQIEETCHHHHHL